MTIDEAIENVRRQVEISKRELGIFSSHAAQKFVENCEQLAEWLEELKVYQQHEIICHKGYNAGYNKAIDDFVEKVELEYLDVHPDELYEKYYPSEICKRIQRLAEELKGRDSR